MATQWDPITDMPDLQGKVAVITGGSTGIGFATLRLLAQRGAKVYFTSRSESNARKAVEKLRENYPDIELNRIQWLLLDLADLKSIDAAANKLRRRETKLHILINNAGAATSSTELTVGGWEQHMTTNYIGPFILSNRVFPLLKNAAQENDADVRIVNVSSIAQATLLPRGFQFQFDSASCLSDPVPAHPWQWRYAGRFVFSFDMIRYAVSKAAVVAFTKELQRRLDESGLRILTICVDPGATATEGVMTVNNAVFAALARWTFITSEQGAATPLFAATAEAVRQDAGLYKGKFLVPVGRVEAPNPVAEDDAQVKGLWKHTTLGVNEQLAAEGLPALEEW